MERFNALWPGGASAVIAIGPAVRPKDLQGKRIGFLWDSMFRGDEIFPLIERELSARYPGLECVGYEAFGSTFGGEEHAVLQALPRRLDELGIDAVISGIGA